MTNPAANPPERSRSPVEHQPQPGSPDAHPRLFVLLALLLGVLAAVGFRAML